MTLQDASPMGYAPPGAVRSVITRFREQGLPSPLTIESIQRIGVTESLAPRTIQALRLLGLVDDEGKVTDQFERLRRSPTSDFKPELVSLLRSAYAPVFEVLEPSGATYEDVHDAFRTFKPAGQRDRMVALFLGLLEYAEYGGDLPTGRTSNSLRSNQPGVPRPKKNQQSVRQGNARADGTPLVPSVARRNTESGERVEVALGSAGRVVVYVDVRWLELPSGTFTALRQAIEAVRALDYANERHKNGPSEEGPSGQPSGDDGGVTPR